MSVVQYIDINLFRGKVRTESINKGGSVVCFSNPFEYCYNKKTVLVNFRKY